MLFSLATYLPSFLVRPFLYEADISVGDEQFYFGEQGPGKQ